MQKITRCIAGTVSAYGNVMTLYWNHFITKTCKLLSQEVISSIIDAFREETLLSGCVTAMIWLGPLVGIWGWLSPKLEKRMSFSPLQCLTKPGGRSFMMIFSRGYHRCLAELCPYSHLLLYSVIYGIMWDSFCVALGLFSLPLHRYIPKLSSGFGCSQAAWPPWLNPNLFLLIYFI